MPMVQASPGLRPIIVLIEMQRRHAGFSGHLRRTLERRIRLWQALHGPEREMIADLMRTVGSRVKDVATSGPVKVTMVIQRPTPKAQ